MRAGANAAPVLVADIGGTNARFALVAKDGDELRLKHRQTFRAEHYENIADAVHAYLEAWEGPTPTDASFAVAGPTGADDIKFTNSPWAFHRQDLQTALGVEALHVINDFEAQALGVSQVRGDDLVTIKPGAGKPMAPRVVFGPGTGLGLSLLVRDGGKEKAISTEGGHAAFAPQTENEIEVLRFIQKEHPYVSYERLLSGRGLVNIHRALCAVAGVTRVTLTPSEITEAALSNSLPVAVEAVDLFCAVLGTFAGDAVLLNGALGGAYIAGGIAPKILPRLQDSAFVDRFNARGPMSHYLADVPIYLLDTDEAAFWGAASLINHQ